MKNNLRLLCSSSAISEIAVNDEKWKSADVMSVEDSIIQEITKGDEKPFFVELIGLYEGMSSNKRKYTVDSVKSCAEAMLGVNMYKGHEEPGSESWRYREPVGMIVSSRVGTIDVDGRKGVVAAIGKAYISDSDAKLRSDIKRKLAGNVSILGNAKLTSNLNDQHKTVLHIHKPLKSVDFCNPGTGGLPLASVTAIVSEMAQHEDQEKGTEMKLTKEQLLAEYSDVIKAIVGEQISVEISEIATQQKEVAKMKATFEAEKLTLDAKIAEMKTQFDALNVENTQLKTQNETEKKARLQSDLIVAAATVVSEMKAVDGADADMIDRAAADVSAVLDGMDVEKSKTAYKTSLEKKIASLVKVAEMFGGKRTTPVQDTTSTKNHNSNPNKGKPNILSKIMAPNLAESMKKRTGS